VQNAAVENSLRRVLGNLRVDGGFGS